MPSTHHRLAALYDIDNPDGPDHDYFRSVVNDVKAGTIVDLGCGTGLLTVTLPAPGRTVIGIDPDAGMLDIAQHRPGGSEVEWRLGSADRIEPNSAEIVIMSGNVAMHIIGDDWSRALHHIADGLRPGGRLVFESRNPLAEAWWHWNDPMAERETPFGPLRESTITSPPNESGVVTMNCYNEFTQDGLVIEIEQALQFRGYEQMIHDLKAAGLEVSHVWRDWQRTPFTNAANEPLMVLEAKKPGVTRETEDYAG